MNRVRKYLSGLGLAIGIAVSVALAGCEGAGPAGEPANSGTVGMSVELTALLAQVADGSAAAALGTSGALFTAGDVMTGTLMATDTATSTTQTFDWSIYLDAATLAVQSNKTIVLPPGLYDFSLLLSRGNQSYAGEALGVAIVDGENVVPMAIRPVIGETATDVAIVGRLVDFRFAYDPGELVLAGFVDPRIGISIDGGPEEVFALDPATGLSEHMFVNLVPGPYHFALRLYDGSLQRGRSVLAQENVTVTPGVNLTMDLVALHGETAFALSEAGGDALFSFSIPAEVVNEAGGVGNLEVLWTLSSPRNGTTERLLSLAPDGSGNYTASETVTPFDFDTVAISLAFADSALGEGLGSCLVDAVQINTGGGTVLCSLTLRRRSIIGGTLLATLGVNVFDTAWAPVAGTKVYANGDFVGITGAGAFGTAGYVKLYLPAGDYTIRGQTDSQWGDSSITLAPLGVDTVDVLLDGGLAPFGVSSVPYSPEAPAATVIGSVSDCDDCMSGMLPIGFEFSFFGAVYDRFNVSSNGYITFANAVNSGCCQGRPIPASDMWNNLIAPAWNDLWPGRTAAGQIRYEVRGSAPSRRLVVDFDLLPECCSAGVDPAVTAQVILYEADSAIEIHTTEMAMPVYSYHLYTQGVENADGTVALYLPGRVANLYSLLNDGVRFGTH